MRVARKTLASPYRKCACTLTVSGASKSRARPRATTRRSTFSCERFSRSPTLSNNVLSSIHDVVGNTVSPCWQTSSLPLVFLVALSGFLCVARGSVPLYSYERRGRPPWRDYKGGIVFLTRDIAEQAGRQRNLSGWGRRGCRLTPAPQNRAHRSPCTRLKQSTYPKRRTAAVNLTVARVMNQPSSGEVLLASMLRANHMVHMKCLSMLQVLVTDRTKGLLPLGQLPLATGRDVRFRPPLSPVVL